MNKTAKTVGYQGFNDILIYENGSFVSPATGHTDIADGVVGKWTQQGYKISETEQSRNPWITDMLDSYNNFLEAE